MNLKTVSALMKRHQAELQQRGVKSLAVFGEHIQATQSSRYAESKSVLEGEMANLQLQIQKMLDKIALLG